MRSDQKVSSKHVVPSDIKHSLIRSVLDFPLLVVKGFIWTVPINFTLSTIDSVNAFDSISTRKVPSESLKLNASCTSQEIKLE